MELRVTVTREHIRKGKPRWAFGCPVALAIREALGLSLDSEDWDVGVTPEYVRIYDKNGNEYYALPAEITQFIRDYDNRRPVRPVTFVLHEPYDPYAPYDPYPDTEE